MIPSNGFFFFFAIVTVFEIVILPYEMFIRVFFFFLFVIFCRKAVLSCAVKDDFHVQGRWARKGIKFSISGSRREPCVVTGHDRNARARRKPTRVAHTKTAEKHTHTLCSRRAALRCRVATIILFSRRFRRPHVCRRVSSHSARGRSLPVGSGRRSWKFGLPRGPARPVAANTHAGMTTKTVAAATAVAARPTTDLDNRKRSPFDSSHVTVAEKTG